MQEENLQQLADTGFRKGGGRFSCAVMIGLVIYLTTSTTSAIPPEPTFTFEGLRRSFEYYPPEMDLPADTNGAVSQEFIVTPLNTDILIQSKSDGHHIIQYPLVQFWSDVAQGCDNYPTNICVCDPVVIFDPYTNRWFFTAKNPPGAILIAASKSADPTELSNWWKSRVPGPQELVFLDQPKIGFNSKWVAVQVDALPLLPPLFPYSAIFVFDKGPLMAGAPPRLEGDLPGQNYVVISGTPIRNDGSGQGIRICPARTYDANLPDLFLLQSSHGPNGVQQSVSALTYYKISGNYAASIPSTLPEGTQVSVNNSWASQLPSGQGAPQMGTTQVVEVDDDRINNCIYRNGSLWAAHTVFLPDGMPSQISAVQWWQISPAVSPTLPSVVQHGIIGGAFTDNVFRAFPSLAVNANEDVLIGYASFSPASYPSGQYSFRLGNDSPGTLQTGEGHVREGLGPYILNVNGNGPYRWGDYSAAVVDPTDDRSMWTIQEFSPASAPPTPWSTWWIGISQTFGRFAAGLLYGVGQRVYPIGTAPTLALSAAGQNANGQLGNNGCINNVCTDSYVPVGVVSLLPFRVIDVAAGDYNSLAVDVQGTVYAWGSNEYGQLGNGTLSPYPAPDENAVPSAVSGLHLFKPDGVNHWYYVPVSTPFGDSRHIVSSGFGTCAAVDYVGRVFTWGINYNGQLGDGTRDPHYIPQHVRKDVTQLPFTDVVSIAAGEDQMVALKADGTVWAWGSGCRGALGDGNLNCHDQLYPIQVKMAPVPGGTPPPLTNVAQVVCGGSGFALALTNDGNVYGWGANGMYQLGLGDQTDRAVATLISSGADRIAAGAYHSLLHSYYGYVYAWGANTYGQCGRGVTGGYQEVPAPMLGSNQSPFTATDIAAGGYFSLVIRNRLQTVYGTGDNMSGQLALDPQLYTHVDVPTLTGYHP